MHSSRLLLGIALALTLAVPAARAGDPVVELDVKPYGYGHSSRVGTSGFKVSGSCDEAVESARSDYEMSPTFVSSGVFCFVHPGHGDANSDFSVIYADCVNYLAWDTSQIEGDIGGAVYTVKYTKRIDAIYAGGVASPKLEVIVTDEGPEAPFLPDIWEFGKRAEGVRVFARDLQALPPAGSYGSGRLDIVIPAAAINRSGTTYLVFRVLGDVANGSAACEWGDQQFGPWGTRFQATEVSPLRVFPPWRDLGRALPGTHGEPELEGTGSLMPGDSMSLTLTNARKGAPAFLCFGLSALNAPLRGGTMVPDVMTPPGTYVPLRTDEAGGVRVSGTWPAGLPSGFEMYIQFWIDDPAGVYGFSASNAVKGRVP